MFRSGTTLFARMLHAHGDVACASDPFRPFFNCFRDAVARDIGATVNDFDPLGDYFANGAGVDLFESIQQATMERPFPDRMRDELREQIASHAEPFSPKITNRLDAVRGEAFRDVYDDLLSYIPAAYGSGTEEWEATKEVWTTEFTPVLARAYPEAKFLHVVRDPRAVCASKNVQETTKYPWLFLIRQWRKLAILSHLYNVQLSDRVHVVRYEDLVRNPRDTAGGICDFLGVPLDEQMLNPSNYVDGSGEPWIQNTSYDESSASFESDSIDKWKGILSDRERAYVEQLSYPEMSLYDYDVGEVSLGISDDLTVDPPRIPLDELADWIQEYFEDWDRIRHCTEIGTERVRQRLLTVDESTFDRAGDRLLKGYFLDPSYAETARAAVQ